VDSFASPGPSEKEGDASSNGKLQTIGPRELHHDSAPANSALSFREYLARKCIPLLSHAPHSPDLTPCDFYLFQKLKSKVRGSHFETPDSVQKAVTDAINALREADFKTCYEAWKIHWAKCL
jgi:histone-lysine N-methyltransferase SETMAR